MARPIGPVARAVLQRLAVRPYTAAQLADELELPVRALVVTCYKLRVAGRIQVSSGVREGGSWRDVAVYCIASMPAAVPNFHLCESAERAHGA